MNQTQAEVRYNVECMSCGQVFQPTVKSSLWWQAKKRAEKGFLDAIRVGGKECGCIEQPVRPDAPFRVFGYEDIGSDFDIPCDTFVDAVQFYRKMNIGGSVLFISGVSAAVEDKLQFG